MRGGEIVGDPEYCPFSIVTAIRGLAGNAKGNSVTFLIFVCIWAILAFIEIKMLINSLKKQNDSVVGDAVWIIGLLLIMLIWVPFYDKVIDLGSSTLSYNVFPFVGWGVIFILASFCIIFNRRFVEGRIRLGDIITIIMLAVLSLPMYVVYDNRDIFAAMVTRTIQVGNMMNMSLWDEMVANSDTMALVAILYPIIILICYILNIDKIRLDLVNNNRLQSVGLPIFSVFTVILCIIFPFVAAVDVRSVLPPMIVSGASSVFLLGYTIFSNIYYLKKRR